MRPDRHEEIAGSIQDRHRDTHKHIELAASEFWLTLHSTETRISNATKTKLDWSISETN